MVQNVNGDVFLTWLRIFHLSVTGDGMQQQLLRRFYSTIVGFVCDVTPP